MRTTALLMIMCLAGVLGATMAIAESPDVEVTTVDAPPVGEAEKVVTADPLTFGQKLYNAVKSKDYWYAVGLFLALVTVGFRRLVIPRVEWFKTSRGGLAAIGITTLLATVALAGIARTPPSVELFSGILMSTAVAMGGYAGLRRLLWPTKQ